MSKSAQVQVLYPRKEGSTFDLPYYLSTHMPLVSKGWTPYGLKGYTVLKFSDDAPYSHGVTLAFDTIQSYQKAGAGPEAAGIMSDIQYFSSESPTIVVGEIVDVKTT